MQTLGGGCSNRTLVTGGSAEARPPALFSPGLACSAPAQSCRWAGTNEAWAASTAPGLETLGLPLRPPPVQLH